MRRGEVWRVRLPPGRGHVQSGIRPAVIVLNDAILATLPTTVIVPFTSQSAATRYTGTHTVYPSQANGLTAASVALVFQVQVLDKRDCLSYLGDLDPSDLDQIIATLDQLTH
jgi:mRNA interferase MazF